MSLWAAVAPLHFIEVPDMGPTPTAADPSYFGTGLPQIRIGHHPLDGFGKVKAHGYYPPQSGSDDQLPGDVHFDDQDRWEMIGSLTYPDILGAAVHELGHSLGLYHSTDIQAVMYPTFPRRQGPGTAFLTADDIAGIQAIYGSGVGSVSPIPEPRGAILLATAVIGILLSVPQASATSVATIFFGHSFLGSGRKIPPWLTFAVVCAYNRPKCAETCRAVGDLRAQFCRKVAPSFRVRCFCMSSATESPAAVSGTEHREWLAKMGGLLEKSGKRCRVPKEAAFK